MLGSQPPPVEMPLVLPPDPATDARLYTYRDLAQLCRVKVQTVMEWVKKGKVPSPMYLGGFTARFRRADVEVILKGPKPANTHTPTTSPRSELQKPSPATLPATPKIEPTHGKHLDNLDLKIDLLLGNKKKKQPPQRAKKLAKKKPKGAWGNGLPRRKKR